VTVQTQGRLEDGEVHLWCVSLTPQTIVNLDLFALLAPDERERAERFRSPTDQARYVATRGWLRRLLSSYLQSDSSSVELVEDDNGKPRLSLASLQWLNFNLAHSHELAVYAFAPDREVGVDVEWIRSDLDVDGIARRYLSDAQRETLSALPTDRRLPTFFEFWARKEAVLKAMGVGLSGASEADSSREKWHVQAFNVADGYAAAVAVEGHDIRIPLSATQLNE
jgi:4'-phosphopantetheinyl transferase